jgi:hypothetical protein
MLSVPIDLMHNDPTWLQTCSRIIRMPTVASLRYRNQRSLIVLFNPGCIWWYSDQFENKTIIKKYLAITEGRCMENAGIIDQPLFTQTDGKVIISKKGKSSQTEWEVKERFRNHTYLNCIH